MSYKKTRLDVYLVQKKIVENRSRAQQLIRGKHITINGKICTKAGELVTHTSKIYVENILKYVSRGGNKLEYALEQFQVNVKGKLVADIGCSTGGFTDCLIQKGAKKVYAVDIGKGQLHKQLQRNPKVHYIDNTDVRYLSQLPNNIKVDLVTIDISQHSLESVLSTTKNFLNKDGKIIALVKPQFELHERVVLNKDKRARALHKVVKDAEKFNLQPLGLVRSPLRGGIKNQGNIEYLIYLGQKPQKFDVNNSIKILVSEER